MDNSLPSIVLIPWKRPLFRPPLTGPVFLALLVCNGGVHRIISLTCFTEINWVHRFMRPCICLSLQAGRISMWLQNCKH